MPLFAACTVMPPQGERIRVERIEQALLPMARTALDAGQATTARRLYSRLLEADPGSADARIGLGDVALANRELAQAATWYLAAVAHAVAPAERHAALLSHGRAALADADVEAARESFSRLADPEEDASRTHAAWGFNGTGVILLLEGKPAEAVIAMERAVLLDPGEPRFQANLARAARIAASYPVEPSTTAAFAPTTPQRDDPSTLAPSDDAGAAMTHTESAQAIEAVGQSTRAAPNSLEGALLDAATRVPPAPVPETAPAEAPAPAAEPPPESATIPVATDVEPEQEIGAPKPATLPPRAPVPQDIEASPPVPAGAFYVRTEDGDYLQVGAYAVEDHATQTAAALRDTTGLPVRVERALRNGRLLYRVHVGPVPPKGLPEHLAGALGMEVIEGVPEGTGARRPQVVVEAGATYVEAAQFTDYADAEAFARRLRAGTGHPVELAKVSLGRSPSVYRVRVGPVAEAPPALIDEIARIRASD
ncbi:MAG: SPOR domain-containing protein [Gammaproteobacteria bacterium]|nr:SPOR domain-containing protein [Gammaproteobacteria bacterium]